MTTEVVGTISSEDDEYRLDFLKRDDGWFSFIEFVRATNWDGERVWTPASPSPAPLCLTREIAEREARERIAWLGADVRP